MNTLLREHRFPNGVRLMLVQGDLTREPSEALVNAANEWLQHGAGVAGALVRGGGERIQRESDEWVRQHGPISHERPAWTSAGDLPARYIIHVVGPRWGEGNEAERLRITVKSALALAASLGVDSLSLPAISTGIFGYPLLEAVRVILSAIAEHARSAEKPALIRLVIYEAAAAANLAERWEELIEG